MNGVHLIKHYTKSATYEKYVPYVTRKTTINIFQLQVRVQSPHND